MANDFEWETVPNPDMLVLHTRIALSVREQYHEDSEDSRTATEIKEAIESLDGVAEVLLIRKYKISIIKGRLHSWESIKPFIERAVLTWAEFSRQV